MVTHHGPSPRGVDPRYAGCRADAARASDLMGTIGTGDAAPWLHGHTHQACDYRVGEDDKRVVGRRGS